MQCGDRIQINPTGDMCIITARGASGQRVNVTKKVRGATGKLISTHGGWLMMLDTPIKVGQNIKYEVNIETTSYYMNQYVALISESEDCCPAAGDICIVDPEGYEDSRDYNYLRGLVGKEVVVKSADNWGMCICQESQVSPERRWAPSYSISRVFLRKPLCVPLSEFLLA